MKNFIKTLILVVINVATLLPTFVESAKILAVFPFPNTAKYMLVQSYLKSLTAKGHELTVIMAYTHKRPIKNYRIVRVPEVHDNFADFLSESNVDRDHWEKLKFIGDYCYNITESVLKNKKVQNLLKTETFDLVITEVLRTEAFYSFGRHFNAPMIGLSSYSTDMIIDELIGNMSPLSYTPLMLVGFTERMTYTERLKNAMITYMDYIHLRWVELPKHEKLLKKYMPHIKEDLVDLRTNFSLMLINQHFSLSFPRPYVPNMVEIGGFHISYKPQALPKDVMSFLNNSTEDVIYFSMGSNLKSMDFPTETLEMFIEVFASLPYKILWQFEGAELPGKPTNVFISSKLPQLDILAHPRVKLFISNGGLLSFTDALYHSKPILGLPLLFEQQMNIRLATQSGYGLGLNYETLTASQLRASILEMMSNPKYIENAKLRSSIYHDRPVEPLSLAIYWTEYVLRHKGALHLQNPAQKMNFLRKHSIDTFLTFCWVLVIFVISLFVFSLNVLVHIQQHSLFTICVLTLVLAVFTSSVSIVMWNVIKLVLNVK